MSRAIAVGSLLQAAVLGGLTAWLAPRWTPAAVMAGVACATQVAAAGLELNGRLRSSALASGGTLLAVFGIFAWYAQAAAHVATAFGPEALQHGQYAMLGLLGVLPWLAGYPAWHFLRAAGGRGLAVLLLAVGLAAGGAGARAMTTLPTTVYEASDRQALATASFAAWAQGGTAPEGGPVLLTPWTRGKPGDTVYGDSPATALAQLPAPGGRAALVVDIVTAQWPAGSVLPPSTSAVRGGASPVTRMQADSQPVVRVLPFWRVPTIKGDGPVLAVESWLVDRAGGLALHNAWAPAPELTAETALAAAIAGGDMLLEHQRHDGRFAYTVKGPSGRVGPGYNFPRHAGASWFLARLEQRTGEARFAEGTEKALSYLADATQHHEGGAWIRDPRRQDGKAWGGTTALAALAAAEHDHPLAGPWGAFLAASVDADGKVRGELDEGLAAQVSDLAHAFPDQPGNPYGQGQVTLALAVLVRAGHDELRPAMERALSWMETGHAPGAAGRMVVLDEHWACLAASAAADVTGTPSGLSLCRGYLADSAARTPVPGDPLAIAAGPGGGMAEAVIAGAFVDPKGPHREQALAFGQLFLDSQYQPEDAPLLPTPAALIGGFRDHAWSLDVRMDAVQHIGCALLGIEELLSGERVAGSRP